jgi:predicted dehydrogenase
VSEPKSNQLIPRRRFLSSTAMLGSSLLVGAHAPAQESAEPINVAVIGTGTQGQVLINSCVRIPGIRIRAICDIWENYNLNRASQILTAFQQEHTVYSDYQDMLGQEKDLQAVIIATPDFCHAPQTVDCLKAGLNVYCESTMSNSIDGARAMVQAARESGKYLQIGHQRRSNPRYQFCFAHIINETRLLGEITALNAQWNRAVQAERGYPRRSPLDEAILKKYGYESMHQFRNWNWYKGLGGGPVTELASHQVDVLNWYMGTPPKSILASGGVAYYSPENHQMPDTVMAVLEYEIPKRNVRAMYQSINNNSNFGYLESFMGDQGTLYITEATGRTKVYREPAAPDWDKWVKIGYLDSPVVKEKEKTSEAVLDIQESVLPPEYNIPVQLNDSVFKPHLENFFNAIRGSEPLNCPAEIAFQSTVTTLKILEAIESGQTARITPEDLTV